MGAGGLNLAPGTGPEAPPARMAVAGGTVVVAGPSGFCIDTIASRDNREGALVMLAACRSLAGGGPGTGRARGAILTASVTPAPAPAPVGELALPLAAYFATDEGRAALSRAGDAATVEVMDSRPDGDLFTLHLRDSAPFPGGTVAAEYRRAILDVNGRMVTVSAYGLPGAGVPGAALLRDFAAAIRRASASAAVRG